MILFSTYSHEAIHWAAAGAHRRRLIRTNGNWLNWDVVAYIPQVCTDCGEEELRRILDGEDEDDKNERQFNSLFCK